jgi:hypothetical protein
MIHRPDLNDYRTAYQDVCVSATLAFPARKGHPQQRCELRLALAPHHIFLSSEWYLWLNYYHELSAYTNIVHGIFMQISYLDASINFEATRIAGMDSSIWETRSNSVLVSMDLEVFSEINIEVTVFRDIILCSPVHTCIYFGEICRY